jgi:hypothetical protein
MLFYGIEFELDLICQNGTSIEVHDGAVRVSESSMFVTVHSRKSKAVCPVTAHWLFACIEQRRVLNGNDDISEYPLTVALPIEGMEKTLVMLQLPEQMRPSVAELVRSNAHARFVVAAEEDDDVKQLTTVSGARVLTLQFDFQIARQGFCKTRQCLELRLDHARTC